MKRGIEILICAGMGLAATGFASDSGTTTPVDQFTNTLMQQQMMRSMNNGALNAQIRGADALDAEADKLEKKFKEEAQKFVDETSPEAWEKAKESAIDKLTGSKKLGENAVYHGDVAKGALELAEVQAKEPVQEKGDDEALVDAALTRLAAQEKTVENLKTVIDKLPAVINSTQAEIVKNPKDVVDSGETTAAIQARAAAKIAAALIPAAAVSKPIDASGQAIEPSATQNVITAEDETRAKNAIIFKVERETASQAGTPAKPADTALGLHDSATISSDNIFESEIPTMGPEAQVSPTI